MTLIKLIEYQPHSLSADRLTQSEATWLWESHQHQIKIEPPSFQNNHQWILTPQGWVGYIPLSPTTTLSLQPKVSIQNLFALFSQLYHLPPLAWLDGLIDIETIEGFWDMLAGELARRVLDRRRKGLAQEFVPKRERLTSLKGRIDPRSIANQSQSAAIVCDYAEQTADLPFNQVLAYTLKQVSLTGICTPATQLLVNRAWRQLPVTIRPFKSIDLDGWRYSRLTEDYEQMHALCRLLLDGLKPTHHFKKEGAVMLPFLINMSRLYEKFVAQWLQHNLPAGFSVREQERVRLDTTQVRHVDLDLVIYDLEQTPVMVLDTKYKGDAPSNDDIYQVTFYAREIGCKAAGLVYPVAPATPLQGHNQDVAYQSLTFSLDQDPQAAGEAFLNQLALK